MSLFPARANLALVLLLLLWSAPSRSLTPDPSLLALVPTGTQILAGTNPATPQNWHGRFLLTTRNCLLDMEDFRSLVGIDPARHIRQVLFVAETGDPPDSEEHGVLVSGHFDFERIDRAALNNGGVGADYRGFKAVAFPPILRRRGVDQVRWLVALPSHVLLFGTVAIVKQELDQKLAPGPQDSRLLHMLAALRNDDDAWSVVLSARNGGIRDALLALSSQLAKLSNGKVLCLGIRYGRRIEFEYIIDPSPGRDQPEPDLAWAPSDHSAIGAFSLLPALKLDTTGREGAHGTVKVSPQLYDRWLAELAHRKNQTSLGAP